MSTPWPSVVQNPSYEYANLWCASLRTGLPLLVRSAGLNTSRVLERARMRRQVLIDTLNNETTPSLHTAVRISYGMGMRFAELAGLLEPLHVPFWER